MRRAAILFISHDWWIDHIEPSILKLLAVDHHEVCRWLKEYGVHDHSLVWLYRWTESLEYNSIQFLFSSGEHETNLPLCADGSCPMKVSVYELNEMCSKSSPVISATVNCRCSLSPITEKQIVFPRVLPAKRGRIIERVES